MLALRGDISALKVQTKTLQETQNALQKNIIEMTAVQKKSNNNTETNGNLLKQLVTITNDLYDHNRDLQEADGRSHCYILQLFDLLQKRMDDITSHVTLINTVSCHSTSQTDNKIALLENKLNQLEKQVARLTGQDAKAQWVADHLCSVSQKQTQKGHQRSFSWP